MERQTDSDVAWSQCLEAYWVAMEKRKEEEARRDLDTKGCWGGTSEQQPSEHMTAVCARKQRLLELKPGETIPD